MKKRTLSLILATAMVAGSLVGCLATAMVAGSLVGCGGGTAASSSAPAEEPAKEAEAGIKE